MAQAKARVRGREEAAAHREGPIGALNKAVANDEEDVPRFEAALIAKEPRKTGLEPSRQAERSVVSVASETRPLPGKIRRGSETEVRRLASLRRADYDGRLPAKYAGLRWWLPWRRKELRRLRGAYRLIAGSPLFDAEWYLAQNPDVAKRSDDPVLHYICFGAREGRAPGPIFDGAEYLAANPDVADSNVNPLVHYIVRGHRENRLTTIAAPDLDSNAQAAAASLGPQASLVFASAEESGSVPSLDALKVPLPYAKALYLKRCDLSVFRAKTSSPIRFPKSEKPFLSIIVPVHNNFRYTIRTLELLEYAVRYSLESEALEIEIIVVDDGSGDETMRLNDFVRGAVLKRTSENLGFPGACNLGAALANGEYLVFLNNDVEFDPDVFVRLHAAIQRDKDEVACFGAAILQLDGTIQDLGSGVWRDGVAHGHFRNEAPTRYAYAYPRDVDYVSGCFFCISAAEFRAPGGFDPCFSPGYYEETDLSLRLWKAGRRSRVYPDIRVYHLEYGAFSSKVPDASIRLMARNRPIFADRHRDVLDRRPEFAPNAGYPVRYANNRLRMLFVEDRVPSLPLGTGYGRSEIIVRALLEKIDIDIFSVAPMDNDPIPADFNYINITYGHDASTLEERLASYHYDVVYVCRPHNMATYWKTLSAWKRGGGSVVYDAEAIFAIREVAKEASAETYSQITANPRFLELANGEVLPAKLADVVVAVSEKEASILRGLLNKPVLTIGHYLVAKPLGDEPKARAGLLFVGTLRDIESPNYDSLLWFLDHVWPQIRAIRPEETLRIAGYIRPEATLEPLLRDGVTCLGPVDDLTNEYARARVFIAPTRFAAGIPFKVHEALSYGLPVVSSLLIADQLANDADQAGGVLPATVKDDGQAFARACLQLLSDDALWREQREAALAYVKSCCALTDLGSAIDMLLGELRERSADAGPPEFDPCGHAQESSINLEDWRLEIALVDKAPVVLQRPIGIFVHIHYDELAEEVAGILAQIELPKRIYVSTNSIEKSCRIANVFEQFGLTSCSEIVVVPNCGWDIAPMLVQFRDKVANHDICLKIHGKKSTSERSEFGERWRKFLYQDLIGDSNRVRAIVAAMLGTPELGLVMAEHFHGVESFINIGSNYALMRHILGRIGVDLRPDQKIEFPSGSMFWFRSEALAELFALGLDWSDFRLAEVQQKDGALAHAIERCFLFFCAAAGKHWGFLPPYQTGQKLSRDEVVSLIRASGAFDAEYYQAVYPDVKNASVDPIEHWVNFGAREARNPSDPSFANPEVYRLLDWYLRGQPLARGATTDATDP